MWIFCLCKYKQQRLLPHDFILIFLTDSAIKSVYIETSYYHIPLFCKQNN